MTTHAETEGDLRTLSIVTATHPGAPRNGGFAAYERLSARLAALESALTEIVDIATPKTFVFKPGDDISNLVWAPIRNVRNIAQDALAAGAVDRGEAE